MATKTSRWAQSEEDAAAEARRKREKEEKRKAKDEGKARQAAAMAKQPDRVAEKAGEPSPKRQRVSSDGDLEEGAQILPLLSRGFGPSPSVDQYELLNSIEEGSYGKVSRARSKIDGQVVALKKLKINEPDDGFPVTGLREIQTLRSCSHPHIVGLHEVVTGASLPDVYLVLSFVEHDLKSLLESLSEPFLPSEIKTLMLQLSSAISYLHTNYILHRDLKTSNILLSNRGEVKLADFGMARFTSTPPPPNLTQLVVTLWYRAPELLLGIQSYSFEVDIWSLGCVFAELLTLKPLFEGKNELDQLSLIFGMLGTRITESWPGFRSLPYGKALNSILSNANLVSKLSAGKFPYLTASGFRLLSSMLSLNPANRPSAQQVLEHQYFREDPKPKPKEMFPTFPSKASQEKRRWKTTPQAPMRGPAPAINEHEAASIFAQRDQEAQGAGFALRMA
ncbi:hypothetical protein DV736_g415, partial [Chaetothyriales sp. CBS 134916]